MKAARLVVLTVALAAGGVAALLAGRSEKPSHPKVAAKPKIATVDVLVAKTNITMGQRLTPRDVAWQVWPADAKSGNFIRRKQHPNAIEALSGAMARAPFVAGEPIRNAKLVMAKGAGFMAAILPAGMRAVSIGVSAESAASGFILPGDHVDVILTGRDRAAEKATGTEVHTSKTILSDVPVLAIGQRLQEKHGQKVATGKTATLELTPRQVETIELARQTGTLSLALRSIADVGKGEPRTDHQNNRGNAISIVRFGVDTMATPQ